MGTQYSKEFKENAVSYYNSHKDLGLTGCAENLGVSKSTLSSWIKTSLKNEGEVPTRGSGNY